MDLYYIRNYAFIRGLYLLVQLTIMFIKNEFMKFPKLNLWSFEHIAKILLCATILDAGGDPE